MGIKKKIARALNQALDDVYVQLDDTDRITGFVVSSRFKGMGALDRQELVDDILNSPAAGLTAKERDRILMIAAVAPVEYHSVGTPVRVCRVRERPGGSVEVALYGNLSDGDFVRKALAENNGIRTTEPKAVASAGRTRVVSRQGEQDRPIDARKDDSVAQERQGY